MKNKEKELLVTRHLIRVPTPVDVSYSDNTRKKLKNIQFNVAVYFEKGNIKAVRIELPCGWLTNIDDPIQSELLEFVRPLNPLYKDLTIDDILKD